MSIYKGESERQRINRAPSPLIAHSVPWASIMLGSFALPLLFIASAPILPPFGFLMLLAWRQLRPGLLPVWVGLPLGLFDDLFSGQPMGSAIFLWSAAIIALDIVESRLPWRNFLMEWIVAAMLIASYIALSLLFANVTGGSTAFPVVVPQIALSVLAYPFVGRFVALLDRMRLRQFMEVG